MKENDFNDRQSDATGLIASANQASSGKPYLGDQSVVETLVRKLAGEVLARFSQVGDGELTPNEASSADQESCHQLARILLGQSDEYTPVLGWSGAGLADTIRSSMSEAVQAGEDDVSVVAQAAAVFVHGIYDQIRYIEDPSKEDDVKREINESVRSFTWLLIGLHQHD